MIDITKDGTVNREAVWLTAWCMVAAASNCTDKTFPAKWADECLVEFDKRFPAPAGEGAREPR